jgi:hypothetical protein
MIPRGASLAFLAVLATACATPAPVRRLATETARNVSIVNTRLRDFARDSEQAAVERATIVRELDARVTEAEKELTSKLEAMRLAGERDRLQLFDELDGILKLLADLDRREAERAAALDRQIAESRSPLAPPVNPLTAAENTLADLGQADGGAERLKFYGAFLGEVVGDVQEAARTQARAREATVSGARSAAAAKQRDLVVDPAALTTP